MESDDEIEEESTIKTSFDQVSCVILCKSRVAIEVHFGSYEGSYDVVPRCVVRKIIELHYSCNDMR